MLEGTATRNDPAHVDRLAALLRPVELFDFVHHICLWLQDAHEAAAELQPLRKNSHRGNWNNNTSFGTDRHQYLLNTAPSLHAFIPPMEIDPAFQSVLLKLGQVGVYQFQTAAGPYGSLADASDLRRELMTFQEDGSLFSRRESWLAGRRLLLLPWSGAEESGLTDTWAGEGVLVDNHIVWEWLVRLQDIADDAHGGLGLTTTPDPVGPTLFEQPQPEIPLRPRAERSPATGD
ncbi:MAG: hypothetical protein ABW215_23030 [Kibdelosporangium sp.]